MTTTTRIWSRWEANLHFLGLTTTGTGKGNVRYGTSAIKIIEQKMKEQYPGNYKVELISLTGPERLKLKFKDEKSETAFYMKYGV